MFTPAKPFGFRWAAAAASGFAFALGACYWLATVPRGESFAARSGYVCANLCALGVGVFCFGAILAYVGRIRKWSPKTCRLAGLGIVVPFALLFTVLGTTPPGPFANLWVIGALFAGMVCQRLVYPNVASDELNAPEPPLTLFPK